MAIEVKQGLNALLSSAYEKDEPAVAELYESDGTTLKDDALDTLLKWDAERVTKLKPNTKEFFDNGYKKGQAEALTKHEKDIMEAFGVQSDKRGLELVKELVEAAKSSGNEITAEMVMKHPAYLNLSEKIKGEMQEEMTKKQKEFEDYKNTVQRTEVLSKVQAKASVLFDSLNPIVTGDAEVDAERKTDWLEKFNRWDYRIENDRIILMKDGEDALDPHGNRLNFDNEAKALFSRYFKSKASEDKDFPKKVEKDKDGKFVGLRTPKDDAEFEQMMSEAGSDRELRAEISRLHRVKKYGVTS